MASGGTTSSLPRSTARAGRALAAAWLADSLEIAEVHVHPDFHRRGIGRSLVLGLAEGRGERTAVLSTQDADSPARRLYRGLGFADLLTGYRFPGTPVPYAVMGAALPLRARRTGPLVEPEQLVDLLGRPRAVQRVEVQSGHSLGEQPVAQPRGELDADLPHRGAVARLRVQPVAPATRREPRAGHHHACARSSRTLVIGMMPAMIGTSQPRAATRSRSRR